MVVKMERNICAIVSMHHSTLWSLLFYLVLYLWYAAAAAKSRQSCPTLCDPTDGSPPGAALQVLFQYLTI